MYDNNYIWREYSAALSKQYWTKLNDNISLLGIVNHFTEIYLINFEIIKIYLINFEIIKRLGSSVSNSI